MASNTDLVRDAYRAFNQRDPDGMRKHLAADVRWYPALGRFLEEEMYVGPDAVVKLVFEEIPAILEGFDAQLVDAVEAKPGVVVATLRYTGRHARTGVEIEQTFFQVIWVRGGRAHEMRAYQTREAALDAVGAGG